MYQPYVNMPTRWTTAQGEDQATAWGGAIGDPYSLQPSRPDPLPRPPYPLIGPYGRRQPPLWSPSANTWK
ncbi:unnamed protein product [Arctogadus glacialis]